MFSVGDQAGRSRGLKKKLETDLPFDVFLVDIDNGIATKTLKKKSTVERRERFQQETLQGCSDRYGSGSDHRRFWSEQDSGKR